MNYYKDLITGAIVLSATKPTGKWWREATEREYIAYRVRISRAVSNLEKATAYKARLLGVKV